ncbi:MAG TPA: response regulator [Ktedonobacteraceae bacterium]|nr:response regulator [Ktedonobacteraceae bacterium]
MEDNQENAHLLEAILQEGAHCQTHAYSSGISVLEHLEEITQLHPALFLVDYTLSGIDGLSLCKHI